MTTSSNVARVPRTVQVKQAAALGVAFVAAAIALSICFGVDFSKITSTPTRADLLHLARGLDPKEIAADVRDEVYSGISASERPHPGDWIAVWGAGTATGRVVVQLSKLAGLKVIAIADVARSGQRLTALGADFLVDRYDSKRAVDIIKAVTDNDLRFGFDAVGKESAEYLQQALRQTNSGYRSHLLGLTGLPKHIGNGVQHHKVPIKVFHEAPALGEALVTWLEDLLIDKALQLPDVDIAEGGLAGINAALDLLRTEKNNGKRIVVSVQPDSNATSPQVEPRNGSTVFSDASHDLRHHDSLNSDPGRVKFAYWVPNVSGGLVVSKIPQNTSWDLKSNVRYAQTAERVGFEYALSQIRFMAGYGAENQHEPVTFSQALLSKTERLKVIAALLPGPWNPAVAAKQIASIDHYSEGRIAVNVVSGWFKAEVSLYESVWKQS